MSVGHLAPILSRLHLRHLCRCRPFFDRRPLSSANEFTVKASPPSSSDATASQSEVEARREAYRQLENLDFMTATKILFTTPPKRKKFGLDFHLVQLFFACLPSLAVYLVAQYARYEIRRMEAEIQLEILGSGRNLEALREEKVLEELEMKKKKDEEEQKAKEAELNKDEEELSEVKARLNALEETVKEIANETTKISSSIASSDQKVDKKDQVVNVDEKSNNLSQQPKADEQETVSKKEKVDGSGP